MSKIIGDSRQKRTEKEYRKKAHEGKKLKGQQTLTSAVSTSARLSWFEKDIIDTEGECCISKLLNKEII